MMPQQRAFSAAAILSLAIGVGTSTAVFGVVDAVLLRKLPVSSPQTLQGIARDRLEIVPIATGYARERDTIVLSLTILAVVVGLVNHRGLAMRSSWRRLWPP
jgi:hypothetical protein